MRRKGLGKGLGMGYKNLVPKDPMVHSLSAKGVSLNARYVPFTFKGKKYTLEKARLDHIGGGTFLRGWVFKDGKIGSYKNYPNIPYTVQGDEEQELIRLTENSLKEGKIKFDAKFSVTEMIYDDQGRNVWVRAKGKKVVDWTTGKKGEIVDDGYSWADVKWEDGTVEKSVAKWKLNAKPSLVTPKQPKTVYQRGMYAPNTKEKDKQRMIKKTNEIKKKIKYLLYDVDNYKQEEATDHELMTITVLKEKLPHFNFLVAHTDIDATGFWKNDISEVSYNDEKNVKIEVHYLDTKGEKIGNELIRLFSQLNNLEVGEDLLYIRTAQLEETSLPLKKWR